MRNPRVTTLYYRLLSQHGVEFRNPLSVQVVEPEFIGELTQGVLAVTMKQHYSTVEAARIPVDAYIRGWEIYEGTRQDRGRCEIKFEYDHADVIDEAPAKANETRVYVTGLLAKMTMSGHIETRITRTAYPTPPTHFVVNPLVDILWRHYQDYCDGKQKVRHMAYYVLTKIEEGYPYRQAAADAYKIERDVLSAIGELTSECIDEMQARKAAKKRTRPDTHADAIWLDAAVKAVIRHIGTVTYGANVPKLSMAQLPSIDPVKT